MSGPLFGGDDLSEEYAQLRAKAVGQESVTVQTSGFGGQMSGGVGPGMHAQTPMMTPPPPPPPPPPQMMQHPGMVVAPMGQAGGYSQMRAPVSSSLSYPHPPQLMQQQQQQQGGSFRHAIEQHQQQQQYRQPGSGTFQMALGTKITDPALLIDGWDSKPPGDKRVSIEKSIASYDRHLLQKNMDETKLQNASVNQTKAEIDATKGLVDRSKALEDILRSHAVPSYAKQIEQVCIPVHSGIVPSAGVVRSLGPDKPTQLIFGSQNRYGQGDGNLPVYNPSTGQYELLGNLKNTQVCKIALENIYSECNLLIGLEFGEGDQNTFTPYESAKYCTFNGVKRFHYIIPPRCSMLNREVEVYVNSKETEHPFAYLYTWLTTDPQAILTKDRLGSDLVGNRVYVKYPINHPIIRYVYHYGSMEGWKECVFYETVASLDEAMAVVAANRIAELVAHKFPTRNLAAFSIRVTVIPDESKGAQLTTPNPLVDMTKLMVDTMREIRDMGEKMLFYTRRDIEQGAKQTTGTPAAHPIVPSLPKLATGAGQSGQIQVPYGFTVRMTYLFRDQADVVRDAFLRGQVL